MPHKKLAIRAYRPADATSMSEIYAHYVRHSVATFDTEVPTLAQTLSKYDAIAKKGHPVLVGEIDGQVIGYCYASFYRPRAGYRFTCEDTIYLHPDHVGQGHGGPLLDAVIAGARAAGFKQMLAVIAGGIDASIGLHERHGFVARGTLADVGYKFDRWIDVVHMQRAL